MSAESRLPSYLDPGNRQRTGIEILDQGLPALPDVLTHEMSIPLAFWKTTSCAVVLFLRYSRVRSPEDDGGTFWPGVTMASFYREDDHWAAHKWWAGTGWSHDPVGNPGSSRDLGGRAIVTGGASSNPDPLPGWPASVRTGRVSPQVTHLSLIQDGREERRELQSHFRAWVVCTDKWSPYEINALDETGTVIGQITGPPPIPPGRPIPKND